MFSLKSITLSLGLILISALTTFAVPIIQETQCGGALTDQTQGGIFYQFNEEFPPSVGRLECIWTVVPGNNSDSINSIKFTMVEEGFDDDEHDNFVTIAYATEDGQVIRAHDYISGDKSSITVPSTIAFVIFTKEYYTDGKGFILYYEGVHSNLDNVQPIPAGLRDNYSGLNGTVKAWGDTNIYQTFVFQHKGIVDEYGSIGLKIKEFNIGKGPAGYADKLNVWGVLRESPGMKEKLLIKPITTIYGSASGYDGGQSVTVWGEFDESLIVIFRGGKSNDPYQYTSVNLEWSST